MKTRCTVVLTTLVFLVGSAVANLGFHLLNAPANLPFYGGVAVLLFVVLTMPAALYRIYRTPKPNQLEKEETHEETTA